MVMIFLFICQYFFVFLCLFFYFNSSNFIYYRFLFFWFLIFFFFFQWQIVFVLFFRCLFVSGVQVGFFWFAILFFIDRTNCRKNCCLLFFADCLIAIGIFHYIFFPQFVFLLKKLLNWQKREKSISIDHTSWCLDEVNIHNNLKL